jgi:hypothetical protein
MKFTNLFLPVILVLIVQACSITKNDFQEAANVNTISWNDAFQSGIYGVHNPNTHEIKWKRKLKTGIYGVFNPVTKEIEWKEKFKGSICGVYNPVTKEIEWNGEISFNRV